MASVKKILYIEVWDFTNQDISLGKVNSFVVVINLSEDRRWHYR